LAKWNSIERCDNQRGGRRKLGLVFYKELAFAADPETGDAEPATRLFARATPVFAAEQVDDRTARSPTAHPEFPGLFSGLTGRLT
jgi:hypothetical protein